MRGNENRKLRRDQEYAARCHSREYHVTTAVTRVIIGGTTAGRRDAVLVIVRSFAAAVMMWLTLSGMRIHLGMAEHGRERLGKTLKRHYRKRHCENQLCQPPRKHAYQSSAKR